MHTPIILHYQTLRLFIQQLGKPLSSHKDTLIFWRKIFNQEKVQSKCNIVHFEMIYIIHKLINEQFFMNYVLLKLFLIIKCK